MTILSTNITTITTSATHCFWKAHHIPGPVLRQHCVLTYSLCVSLQHSDAGYKYTHFTDKETEAQRLKWLNVSLLSLAPEAILATTLYTEVGSQDKEGPPDSVFIQGCWNKLDRCAAGE